MLSPPSYFRKKAGGAKLLSLAKNSQNHSDGEIFRFTLAVRHGERFIAFSEMKNCVMFCPKQKLQQYIELRLFFK